MSRDRQIATTIVVVILFIILGIWMLRQIGLI
jgi:flagellar biogenesis protein FliO